MDFIRFSMLEGGIAHLVVDRPDVRNAFNWQAMDEFCEVIESLEGDEGIRVLLISGAGNAFVSGADLQLVSAIQTIQEAERLSGQMGDALARLRRLPLITIAQINGPARGGGAELAVSCDLRVMAEGATIAFVQARLGLIPGWGGANRLYDLVGYSQALDFLATARVIDAQEALRVGLVNVVFSDELLADKTLALAQQITANDQESVKTLKRLLAGWEVSAQQGRLLEEREQFLALWDRDARRARFEKFKRK